MSRATDVSSEVFTPGEEALLAEAARAVVRRRMAVPTMMFLEMMSPMNTVSASMLHVLTPIWRVALPASRIEQIATLMERRAAIPALIRAIDSAEEQRRRDERAARPPRPPRRWLPWPRRGDASPPTRSESTS